jgi:hypothetical protein
MSACIKHLESCFNFTFTLWHVKAHFSTRAHGGDEECISASSNHAVSQADGYRPFCRHEFQLQDAVLPD